MHPIHRWPSFRLGILLIFFLVLTWMRSSFYNDEAALPHLLIQNQLGHISLTINPDGVFSSYATSNAIHPLRLWFPAPLVIFTSTYAGSSTPSAFGVNIAHWFLILLTLIAWLTLLSRKRKQLRLLTELQSRPNTTTPEEE